MFICIYLYDHCDLSNATYDRRVLMLEDPVTKETSLDLLFN